MKKRILIAAGLICLLLIFAGVYAFNRINADKSLIRPEVAIETGASFSLEDFLDGAVPDASFYTDVEQIDTSVPGSYLIDICFRDLGVEFHQDSVLIVSDTTAPVGTPLPQVVYCGDVPDPSDVVADVYDLSPVTVSYRTEPDLSAGGDYTVEVDLADAYGNHGTVEVPFTVIDDHLAPLMYGAHDIEAFIGHNISYLDGITVTDNYDPDPQIYVDTSEVSINEPGVYPVTYTVIDENGNSSFVTVDLTLRIEPERYYEPEVLYDLCRQLNEQYSIYTDDMTDVQKAFRIFCWSHQYIYYAGVADKTDWTCAAYDGLTTLHGDCYTYYAVNRAFLDMEGIPNLLVARYPVTWSPHYWNLVYLDGAWYHCDSLAFSSPRGYYFMCAVEDLNPFDHLYDESLYGPEINIAQEPVAQYVHYDTLEVDEF